MADVVLIAKADTAHPAHIQQVKATVQLDIHHLLILHAPAVRVSSDIKEIGQPTLAAIML